MPAISPLPSALSELFAQVSISGEMTLADRYGILAVLLNPPTNAEELYCIDRILYRCRQGRVRLVDELSTIL